MAPMGVWAKGAEGWRAAAPPVTAQAPEGARAPSGGPQPVVMEAIIDSAFVGPQHVVFVLPPGYEASGKSYPAVLAFAGLGESVRGNRAGAWGWVEKYGVVPAMAALHRGDALTPGDFQGLIKGEALEGYNAALREVPYEGVILVCPYPPNVLKGSLERSDYERYLLDELIPYTIKHLRVPSSAGGWGVDGISLGGLLSTWVGFKHPERFGAIGSQQASVNSRAQAIDKLVARNLGVLRTRRLNVATSAQDPFKEGLKAFSARLTRAGLEHRFTILPGHHDKRFVKGPGSFELLLFHDRALRGGEGMPPARKID